MAEQIFRKDTETHYSGSYGGVDYNPRDEHNDYVSKQELTVTITLHEYRQMVWELAKHNELVERKEKEARDARMERDELKKQVDALKAMLNPPDEEEVF